MNVTAIPLDLSALKDHLRSPQHSANEVLWVGRHPGRRRSNWKPPVHVETYGAAVDSVAVDDTFGVAIASEYDLGREVERRAAAAHEERALEQQRRRATSGVPAWQPAARVSSNSTATARPAHVLTPAAAADLASTPFPTPRTFPTTPRPTPTMQPTLPATPLPPAQPQPVLWYELPDHYRTRMRKWYGPQLPGPPWTPAGDRPFPYPVVPSRHRYGINEYERDIHYQIRVEAYYRQPFTRESLFRDQPRVPPPATAHSPPVSTWGQPSPPAWGEPTISQGTHHSNFGRTQLCQPDQNTDVNAVAWDPPRSRYDEGATHNTWGPAYPIPRPTTTTPPPADADIQPRRHPIVRPALQQKRQPIVRPAARPATPPDLAPLTRYTCPKCQAAFDGLNSFPPITDRVNDHLRTVGSPELSDLEKSFIHRRWWGSHDCEDPSYIMFYLNTIFEWRED